MDAMNRRLAEVDVILLDVDGVLTDGGIIIGPGGFESKQFDVRDGHRIRLAMRAGMGVYFVTGRTSESVARRAAELEINGLYQGVLEKGGIVADVEKASGKERARMAYMGDDLVDLPPMALVGLSGCPADAAPEVRERSALIAPFDGGKGAAAWFIEEILKARGDWSVLIERYLAGA